MNDIHAAILRAETGRHTDGDVLLLANAAKAGLEVYCGRCGIEPDENIDWVCFDCAYPEEEEQEYEE